MAARIGATVFVLGALAVWLVVPIGDPCPDAGKLPPGSTHSSAPSFSPPLTRRCTYTTPDGIKARSRYVPVLDLLLVAVVAGIATGGAAVLGGTGEPRAPRAPRTPRTPREPVRREPQRREPAERGDEERERARRERAERARRDG
ncbi:MAG TPA: hypothetical protein VMY78_08300 [Solirubrobacteraceae bacterium]|nr:hypothetical protein [Solirubrobacteraceae bacterium]